MDECRFLEIEKWAKGMPLLEPRRWFQYRISTWFALVAILAWASTCRGPWITIIGPDATGEAYWRWGPTIVWPVRLLVMLIIWKAGCVIRRAMKVTERSKVEHA